MKSMQRTIHSGSSGIGLRHWSVAALLAACLGAFLSAGCAYIGKVGPVQFASVVIHGQTHDRVRDVAAEVFRENGYQVTRNGWADLVFERQGSAMNNLAYGSLMEGNVWMRVKASVVDLSPDTCRLQCQAFAVQSRGEALEEEIPMNKVHSHQYQKLLDEVAKRLSGKQAAPN